MTLLIIAILLPFIVLPIAGIIINSKEINE